MNKIATVILSIIIIGSMAACSHASDQSAFLSSSSSLSNQFIETSDTSDKNISDENSQVDIQNPLQSSVNQGQKTEQSQTKQMSAEEFLNETSDDYLCDLFIISFATGVKIPKYAGFNSPTEITSNGLLNAFLLAANGDDYYDNNLKKYVYSVSSIEKFLSNYFECFNFNPLEDTLFQDCYNSSKQQYETRAFAALFGPVFFEISDKIINDDGTITIKGVYLFEEEVVAYEELTFKIDNGKTIILKYKQTYV